MKRKRKTFQDLITTFAFENKMSTYQARPIVKSVFKEIEKFLIDGNDVYIARFGIFRQSVRKPYTIAKPINGNKPLTLPKVKTIHFAMFERLKNKINNKKDV